MKLKKDLKFLLIIILIIVVGSYLTVGVFGILKSLITDFYNLGKFFGILVTIFFIPLFIRLIQFFINIVKSIVDIRKEIFKDIFLWSFSFIISLIIQFIFTLCLYKIFENTVIFKHYFKMILLLTEFLLTISSVVVPSLLMLKVKNLICEKVKRRL